MAPTNSQSIECRRGIVRCAWQGRVRYGLVEQGELRLYDGSPFGGGRPGAQAAPLDEVRLLAPCRPGKVVAVGLNYRSHAAEMGMDLPEEPMLFMKPSTAVIGPGQPILWPAMSNRVDYEAELGVVMGRRCAAADEARAAQAILGYTCLNDVTARDLQAKDKQFIRAKGFDTFCPLGPVIALDLDPLDCDVTATVGGAPRQQGHTSDLIFSPARLVSFISQVMTLHPGDVIATGTPGGIGPVTLGQEVTVRVAGVGSLCNPVKPRG